MQVSLDRAESDGHTSISFPSLGCGFLKYPPSLAANFTIAAIQKFCVKHPNPTLTRVVIVTHGSSNSLGQTLQVN